MRSGKFFNFTSQVDCGTVLKFFLSKKKKKKNMRLVLDLRRNFFLHGEVEFTSNFLSWRNWIFPIV